MPRFIAVHSVAMTEEQLREFAKSPLPPDVSWNRTYCDFDDDKHFCEWEAPDKETVKRILRENEIPFDAVYPVRVFEVSTATLEPK